MIDGTKYNGTLVKKMNKIYIYQRGMEKPSR